MTDSERLVRMERRQEAVIQGISGLAEIGQVNNAMLAELMEWLKQPPSNELSDSLAALAASVAEMRQEISALPERVARAVLDGDVGA